MDQTNSAAPPVDEPVAFTARLRALVRGNEIALVGLAAIVGVVSGLLVTAVGGLTQWLHVVLFRLSDGERLSGLSALSSPFLLAVPICGGIVLGVLSIAVARWQKRPLVDPIEANALRGGRMALRDSVVVVVQNVVSNGFGGSVGLEAAYTQLSAGIASRLGIAFEMRRSDLRTLVGCGAAAAIAAAFNAPLTGAFYAFELVIGTYSIATLTPVVAAALAGTLTARLVVGDGFLIDMGAPGGVSSADYPPALVLAVLSAGLGILIMQGVTLVEAAIRKSGVPSPLRPVLGGCVLAGLALVTPQVLSSGHGALHLHLDSVSTGWALAGLLVLKSLASAVSIGSGFRGGLFFASLFLGALLGKLFGQFAPLVFETSTLTPIVFAIVGMSSLAVAIVGGPLTMTFLALEMTGDFPITALVLAAAVTTSITVRKTFGYSFATWRFHLRGESIRSAHDIGWIRSLTVGRMMRSDVKTVASDMVLKTFRRDFPLGSTQRVVLTDSTGAYAGIVLVPEVYAEGVEDLDAPVSGLMRWPDAVLLPQMNAREAMGLFDKVESEALAVVDATATKRVVGLLTESHTLRRYSEELDLRRREAAGETT